MAGPANAGLFIYAKDLEKLASFYESLLKMKRLHQTKELIVLDSPDIQLVIHKIPDQISKDIDITVPPKKRENTALKFFFTVSNLNECRTLANTLGGAVFNENWQGNGFVLSNACDPEGNIFQVREKSV